MIGVGDRGGDEARTLQMLQGTIPLGSLALTTYMIRVGDRGGDEARTLQMLQDYPTGVPGTDHVAATVWRRKTTTRSKQKLETGGFRRVSERRSR